MCEKERLPRKSEIASLLISCALDQPGTEQDHPNLSWRHWIFDAGGEVVGEAIAEKAIAFFK